MSTSKANKTSYTVPAELHAELTGVAEKIGMTLGDLADFIASRTDLALSRIISREQSLLGSTNQPIRASRVQCAVMVITVSQKYASRLRGWAKTLRVPNQQLFINSAVGVIGDLKRVKKQTRYTLPPFVRNAIHHLEDDPHVPTRKQKESD